MKRMKNMMKSEYLESNKISQDSKNSAKEFVVLAKKIARIMSTNYNQKKKAYEAASTSYHTNGTLDISRIHSYKTSDDVFKKKISIKEGQSHGLICALDFSMSMSDILPSVAMQFLVLSLFSKYSNIEFKFFTFTSSNSSHSPGVKNIFRMSNKDYARFVDIGNNSFSEASLIESFYHIMSLSAQLRNSSIWSKRYTEYLRVTLGDLNFTPLNPAIYQSFLLAKEMQSKKIQNVNIIIVNDGDNNGDFVIEQNEYKFAASIEDPFSKRIYSLQHKVNRNNLLSPMNRMIRENGIKIYNIFLNCDNTIDTSLNLYRFRRVLESYVKDTDIENQSIPLPVSTDMYSTMNKTGIVELKNLCYYDSVIFADTSMFPNLNNINSSGTYSTNNIISGKSKQKKKLSLLGNLISDYLVEDFKLSNINKNVL